jgi:uncharacterized protein YndB with AHSA1/START domain
LHSFESRIPFYFYIVKQNKQKTIKKQTMETTTARQSITIETTVNATPEKAWKVWNTPEDIIQWCSPSPDWHTPRAQNDLRVGGQYLSRMEAKDGSFGFDFGATYDAVRPNEHFTYTMGDGRKVVVDFIKQGNQTKIVQTFDAENENPIEMQRAGWQAILDNYKKYVEAN